ncbi:uncharacterized protein G2W53_014358 [Senna tora]|uniref:Uncharacterized protein n=1 Tax=Senna tora TaxID=362788 RepID=A0A834WTD3_9FABA|nr:uncharacterized protein G2W53_014358 [Senna tora]
MEISEIRLRFDVRNMLIHDPRSSHAMTTPIGTSNPPQFANTTRTDVFDSLAQQVFCLVINEGFRDPTAISRPEYVKTCSKLLPFQDDSNWNIKSTPVFEIRLQFVVRNILRHDSRSSNAKKTPIGASKPLRFANTTRTDVFDALVLQVFCLVIREGHDPRSSHAKMTPIGASKPLRFANTRRTDLFDSLAQQVFCLVSEIRPRFVLRNILIDDPRSSHGMSTAIGASKPLRFANTMRTDVFDSLAQQVFCLVSEIRPRFVVQSTLRHDPRSSHAKNTPIGASRRVYEVRPRFVVRNMLIHDQRFSHAMAIAIGASKRLRFANTTRTVVVLRNLHELRGKRLVAQVSQTRRFALYLRTGVVLMLQMESPWHGRSVDHVLTYSRRPIVVGYQKPSGITRQKTCCASESNTSVRVVFVNHSGFDVPIGVVLAWEERGSCINIFWMTNRGRISETFTNYEAKYLLRK